MRGVSGHELTSVPLPLRRLTVYSHPCMTRGVPVASTSRARRCECAGSHALQTEGSSQSGGPVFCRSCATACWHLRRHLASVQRQSTPPASCQVRLQTTFHLLWLAAHVARWQKPFMPAMSALPVHILHWECFGERRIGYCAAAKVRRHIRTVTFCALSDSNSWTFLNELFPQQAPRRHQTARGLSWMERGRWRAACATALRRPSSWHHASACWISGAVNLLISKALTAM